MALHWDITAIPDEVRWVDARDDDGNLIMDEETGKPQKQISPTTDALIWASMSVDMGEITKKNYQKFAERLNLIQNLDGPFMVTHTPHGTIGRRITEEDVKNNIGLSTNVYTETDAKFRKKLFRDNFKLVARVRERLELFELKQSSRLMNAVSTMNFNNLSLAESSFDDYA